MDDWERHFSEKSRRRFERDEREREQLRWRVLATGALIAAVIIASIAALALQR